MTTSPAIKNQVLAAGWGNEGRGGSFVTKEEIQALELLQPHPLRYLK